MCGHRVVVIEVPWNRRRGSPKRKWLDNIRNQLSGETIHSEQNASSDESSKIYKAAIAESVFERCTSRTQPAD